MMMNEKNISVWQAAILMFILTFANKILEFPSLLYENAKLEACFVPFLLFLFDLGLLFLFCRLKRKFPNQSFADLIEKYCGKFVMRIVYVFVMIYFLLKAVLLYNVTYDFLKNMIYRDSNNWLFLFCFLPVINYLAIAGLRPIGRTAQLFFPLILIVIVFCVGVGVFGIESEALAFQSSAQDIFIAMLKHITSFGDTLFLFVIMDKVNIKKGQEKVLFIVVGIAMLLVCAVTIVFIFSYSYTSFMHPFAIFEIISYIQEFGGLGRLDIIAMIAIILLSYFQLAIYLKAFMVSFCAVFKKLDKIYSVLTFNIAFVLIVYYVVLNLESTIIYGQNFLPYFSILPFVIVPIFVLIFLLLGDKDKNKKLAGEK